MPGCSVRSAASCTWSTSPRVTAASSPTATTSAQPAWSPDGHTVAFTRKVGDDSDLTFRTAVHLLDVDDPKATPGRRRVRGRHRRHRLLRRRRREPARRRPPGAGARPRPPRPRPARRRRARRPHRPPRPQRDARRPGLPRRPPGGARRRPARSSPCATGAAPTCWTRRRSPVLAGDGPRRLRPLGRGRPRRRRARHAHVVRRDRRRSTSTSGAETVLTDHGAGARRRRPLRPRGARPSRSPTAPRCRPGWSATPSAPARGRCCSTSTAARTTPGTARPTRCTSTTRSSPPGAGRCCWSTRAAATATARRSTTGVNGAWGVADAARLPRADRRARRRGPRRPGPARGHRLQLRRVHDLLADRPRPTGSRPRSPAASSATWSACTAPATTARSWAATSSAARRGDRRRAATPRCRRSPTSTRSRTPTLVLHGEDDLTCPVGQAQQWHTALRDRGVPTELVLYPGASHVFILLGKPSQRMDYNRRVVDWVEQYAERGGRPRLDRAHWQRRLEVLAEKHHVPGAQLGILRRATARRRRHGGVRRPQQPHRRSPRPPTRSSRSARSARSGRPRSSCSWSTRG